MPTIIRKFFDHDAASGIVLMVAALLALVVANSPLSVFYEMLISIPAGIHIGQLSIDKPILLWVNDGLMAVFFFLIGLELKREILQGELSKPSQVALPVMGAIGGMIVPAAIYLLFNIDNETTRQGWAIPAATDIAFALGILALLGKQVPTALKVFLVTLAIIDDIGAIVIIALFYTDDIANTPLYIACACLAILWWFNRRNITDIPAYMLVGAVLWISVLKSGVHATLAGVLLAFFIPMEDKKNKYFSPAQHLEDSLHSSVVFVILPIFAFANAGISVTTINMEAILHPVTLGIAFGLLLGKPLGVFGICYLAVKTKLAKLPQGMTMLQLAGLSCLCGVGFTMSLFIGSLAFEATGKMIDERLGILTGSFLSALLGFALVKFSLLKSPQGDTKVDDSVDIATNKSN
ncbi:Na+/H+ antiporter NhaA [Thalassotalea aquiviva]|uniref:Na+/H+ antiporter NhaA n=1 Tax=Thalassotalea aquiviva TaxID=3242415 RepID=UPI00352A68BD